MEYGKREGHEKSLTTTRAMLLALKARPFSGPLAPSKFATPGAAAALHGGQREPAKDAREHKEALTWRGRGCLQEIEAESIRSDRDSSG